MIQWTEQINKQYTTILIIAIALYVLAPIIYLVVATFLSQEPSQTGGETQMLFYILLILAAVQPLVIPFLEKSAVKTHKTKMIKSSQSSATNLSTSSQLPAINLFTVISIIKAALVESIYIFGMVVTLITKDMNYLYYFYPIGMFWTFIYFPTRTRCINFLTKVESYAP